MFQTIIQVAPRLSSRLRNLVRSHIPRRDAPPMPRVLLMSDEEIDGLPSAETSSISRRLPSFLAYDVVVIKVPETVEVLQSLRDEVRQAELAGVTVIWLIMTGSTAEALRYLVGTDVHTLGAGVGRARLTLPDARFSPILEGVLPRYAFALPRGFTSISYLGADALSVAAVRERPETNLTIVVPWPSSNQSVSINHLISLAGKIRAIAPPVEQQFHRLLRVAYVFGLLALCASGLWYAQRHLNRRHDARISIDRVPLAAEVTDIESAEDLTKIVSGDQTIGAKDGPLTTDVVLRAMNALGMYGRETELLQRLGQSETFAPDSPVSLSYANKVWFAEIATNAAAARYEATRYFAQRYINLATKIPPSEATLSVNRRLDACRKLVKLINGHELYRNRAVVSTLITEILDRHAAKTRIAQSPDIDASLTANVDYYNTVIDTASVPPETSAILWHSYADHHPNSDLLDDAAFNEISATMSRSRLAKTAADQTAINQASMALIRNFVARYPGSPLKDDALMYEVRVASKLSQRDLVWASFVDLMAMRAVADSPNRCRYAIAHLLLLQRTNVSATPPSADHVFDAAHEQTNSQALDEFLLRAADANAGATVDDVLSAIPRDDERRHILSVVSRAARIDLRLLPRKGAVDVAQGMIVTAFSDYRLWVPL